MRVSVFIITASLAVLFGWLFWPSAPEIGAHELSRADGKPRFDVTKYPRVERPANLSLPQRIAWEWAQYKWRHRKRNPATYSFPATPVQPCSIHGLLNQCMEVSGTRYYIAVEIAGGIDFGHTNVLNGAQWIAGIEKALESSTNAICYDYAKKRNFVDGLVLIRERRGVVKVLPRTKLADYERAGLCKAPPQGR